MVNPSALFLSDREQGAPGTAVFAGMEGTRPLLVEIQALVAPRPSERRAAPWWDGIPTASPCCSPCSRRAAA